MIIKRRYEHIGRLMERDPESKKVFYKAFRNTSTEHRDYILQANHWTVPHNATMGSCLENYGEILKGLDKLDEDAPYDNGFDYRDVNKVEYVPSPHGNGMQIILIYTEEGVDTYIQVFTVNSKDGKPHISRNRLMPKFCDD